MPLYKVALSLFCIDGSDHTTSEGSLDLFMIFNSRNQIESDQWRIYMISTEEGWEFD